MSLKIGFFGSAPFVTEFLSTLYNSPHKIAFIVTSADKPKGRGKVIAPPEAKQFAIENNIPFFQPENINDADFLDSVKKFNADLFLVIAYGKKLKKDLLYMPPLQSFNLHFSLLPRWRGAAPVNWAIIAGDRETGITFMKMDEGLDTGDIVFQKGVIIDENETAEELFGKLILMGKSFLIESLTKIEQRDYTLTKQDNSKSTYAATFKKDDGLIDWKGNASEVHNKIRGLQPWPSAFTFYRGKRIKLLKSKIVKDSDIPGKIIKIEKDGITVSTGCDAVKILELQEEGKNRISAVEFARGKGNIINSFFDNYGNI